MEAVPPSFSAEGLGAIVLTGGASSRMGTDKAAIRWNGVRAVDRVFTLATGVGAAQIITVGHTDHGRPFLADEVCGGGPVGGVLAGAAALRALGLGRMLVLAVDAPTIRPADLEPLLKTQGGAAYAGLHLPFVADIAALPSAAMSDWPLARLIETLDLARQPCPPHAQSRLRGANTPAERDALLLDLDAYEAAPRVRSSS